MNKFINITKVSAGNKTVCVNCEIPNYSLIKNRVEIGELISTKYAFDVNFPNFTSQWTLIFFPKGQYDNGVWSKNCRAYMKLNTYSKADGMLQIKINIAVQSSSFTMNFILNDNNKNWCGPFHLGSLNEIPIGFGLKITCTFEAILKKGKVEMEEPSINRLHNKKPRCSFFSSEVQNEIQKFESIFKG